MKIIVVNVNTSKSMTDVIAEAAGRYASPGTTVVTMRPYFGIGAAVRLAEAVVGLGLKTSKISTYARPDAKKITGWPLWQALGVPRAPARGDAARAAVRSGGNDDPPR